jgi:hypothetical protein
MKRSVIVPVATVLLATAGCAIKHPQTADEFRAAAPKALSAKVERFEVDRPFADVAAAFKTMAPKCLAVRVTREERGPRHYHKVVTRYAPTVHVTREKAELHLQMDHEAGVMSASPKPAGGYYVLVVDARPVAPNRTAIDMYRPTNGLASTVKAVTVWTTGENVGCPDLTK